MRQIDQAHHFRVINGITARKGCQFAIVDFITRATNAVTGICRASIASIAADIGYSEPWTRGQMLALEAAGVIGQRRRFARPLPSGLRPQLCNDIWLNKLPEDDPEEARRMAREHAAARKQAAAARKKFRREQRRLNLENDTARLAWQFIKGAAEEFDVTKLAFKHSDAGRRWAKRLTPTAERLIEQGLHKTPIGSRAETTYERLMREGLAKSTPPPTAQDSPNINNPNPEKSKASSKPRARALVATEWLWNKLRWRSRE
jgi:hypothetical protein